MIRIIAICCMLLFFAQNGYAENQSQKFIVENSTVNGFSYNDFFNNSLFYEKPCLSESMLNFNYELKLAFEDLLRKRGCCSWHKGVCGCSGDGKVICCDGKYSPTCRC